MRSKNCQMRRFAQNFAKKRSMKRGVTQKG